MPTMFPHVLPDFVRRDPRKAAEVAVYDALEAALPDAYDVYHSVAWVGRRKDGDGCDGEADFVLAHPERGVLVLEVKGGEILYDAPTGKWASRDNQGDIHDIKNPFAQAARSKHALLAKLQQLPVLDRRWIDMAHGVCFPTARKGRWALRPDAPPAIIIDQADMADLAGAVARVHAHWQGDRDPSPLGDAGMAAVRRLLGRSFELRTSLGVAVGSESEQILRLTEEQFQVLDLLSHQRRAAIRGGAGTGKTVLALEKARRLAGEGLRTLLTCFNLPLEAHLRASAGDVPGLTIRSFHPLCYEAARAHEVDVPPMDPDARPGTYWEQELPDALLQALDNGMARYDALVVDEGQDFADGWWLPLQHCLANPEDDVLHVFLDPHQRLYGREAPFVDGLPSFPLTRNLRNSVPIHEAAARFYRGTALQPAGLPGREPEVVAVPPGKALPPTLERVLRRLHQEEAVPPEAIAVLLGRRAQHVGLAGRERLGDLPLTDAEHPRPGYAVLDTIYRYKGLDAAVVVLTGLAGMSAPIADTLLYVGMTRARSHLLIVEHADVLAAHGLDGAAAGG